VCRDYLYAPTDGGIVLLDPLTGAVLSYVPLSSFYYYMSVDPKTGHVYISLHRDPEGGYDHSVLVMDGDQIVDTIGVGTGASMSAVDDAANRIYVLNAGDYGSIAQTISVIDRDTGIVIDTLPAAFMMANVDTVIGVDPTTGYLYILGNDAVTGFANIWRIDPATHALTLVAANLLGDTGYYSGAMGLEDGKIFMSFDGIYTYDIRTGNLTHLSVSNFDGKPMIYNPDKHVLYGIGNPSESDLTYYIYQYDPNTNTISYEVPMIGHDVPVEYDRMKHILYTTYDATDGIHVFAVNTDTWQPLFDVPLGYNSSGGEIRLGWQCV
jgi:hypothetical protein